MTRTVRYAGADVTVLPQSDGEELREHAQGIERTPRKAPHKALTLLDVARRELGVRSASAPRCVDGKCGACRLLVDGELVNACAVLWENVRDGATIEAYETLADDEAATRAIDAFAEERPTRCRLCIGGLGVTAVSLARAGKQGDPDAIEAALITATCMCTGRGSLRRALLAKPR